MIKLNTGLTQEQAKFAMLLERFRPCIRDIRDLDTLTYCPKKADDFIKYSSDQEVIVVRFLLGVWRGDNKYQFDLFEAVQVLDFQILLIVKNWLEVPFLPKVNP